MSNTIQTAEPVQQAFECIGQIYQIGPYTPPRHINLPLTIPQGDRSLQINDTLGSVPQRPIKKVERSLARKLSYLDFILQLT